MKAHDKRRRNRNEPWVGIIIHHTNVGDRDKISQDLWQKLYKSIGSWLTKKDRNYVSAHYFIGRYGEVAELVNPESHVAYHAGKSSYFHPIKRRQVSGWNEYAIGIELLGDGNSFFYSDEQYEALAATVKDLLKRFPRIDPRCITGHENIAPKRKNDPGVKFEWDKFFRMIYS